jgi:hypothetical protein
VWQSKRPLNKITDYFSHPWNEERRETLRILQHAALAIDSIALHNPEFAEWIEGRVVETWRAYKSGDYALASSIAGEILKESSQVNNPLGIVIDGNGREWVNLDPIYYNASEQLPPLELLAGDSIPMGGGDAVITKNLKSLKAVYAVNDPDNLYLMLEFYGPPPTRGMRYMDGPNISIDTSGIWSHENGKEFEVLLSRHVSPFGIKTYKGMEQRFETLYELREFAYGDVIEVKIPLKYIQNPEKINLLVWYQTQPPWGGMEVEIVDWGK